MYLRRSHSRLGRLSQSPCVSGGRPQEVQIQVGQSSLSRVSAVPEAARLLYATEVFRHALPPPALIQPKTKHICDCAPTSTAGASGISLVLWPTRGSPRLMPTLPRASASRPVAQVLGEPAAIEERFTPPTMHALGRATAPCGKRERQCLLGVGSKNLAPSHRDRRPRSAGPDRRQKGLARIPDGGGGQRVLDQATGAHFGSSRTGEKTSPAESPTKVRHLGAADLA